MSRFDESNWDYEEGPELAPTKDEADDRYLYSMIRYLLEGGEKAEAQMLLSCELTTDTEVEHFSFGDPHLTMVFTLRGPRRVYEALGADEFIDLRSLVANAAMALKPSDVHSVRVERGAILAGGLTSGWREDLAAIMDGRDVDNQAIGFSATQTWQGLRFRSKSEVRIAEALENANVMFFPNCKARLGSRDRRRNSEADFAVMLDGVWGVLEVDGPHHEGRASADHERDRPFHHHGAAIVQRYESLRCFQDAEAVVLEFLALLKKKAR